MYRVFLQLHISPGTAAKIAFSAHAECTRMLCLLSADLEVCASVAGGLN